MELNTEEYFLLLFVFNRTLTLLPCLSEAFPPWSFMLSTLFIWFSPSRHHLLPTSILSSLAFLSPHLPSLFPQSLWSPVFPAYHLFSLLFFLGHICFSLHFCLSFIFLPVINHPALTELANSSSCFSFPHLPQSPLWPPRQIHADPRTARCSPHPPSPMDSLSCSLHTQFDSSGARISWHGTCRGTKSGTARMVGIQRQ